MRQFFQIFLFASGRRKHLVRQQGYRLEGFVFMGADDVGGSEFRLVRRKKEIDLLTPLRLNGCVRAKHKARALELTYNLQAKNRFSGAWRGDDVHAILAFGYLLVDQLEDFVLISTQRELKLHVFEQRFLVRLRWRRAFGQYVAARFANNFAAAQSAYFLGIQHGIQPPKP